MRHALVTGGCGFLGSSIVRALLERNVRTRVLALPQEAPTNLDGLEVEIVRGNILSIEDVKRAVEGVDVLFHAAALYKDVVPEPTHMYEVNLRGTFNVLEAARRAGVGRSVVTASIVALGRPGPGKIGDESTLYDAWNIDFPYGRSKFLSRMLAEDFGRWGLSLNVVCPGVILGPRDIAPTPSGRLIVNTVKNNVGVYTDGGINYVDVRDAAKVHVLAVEKGRPGETYLATAHNLDHRELILAVGRAVGRTPRVLRVPRGVALGVVRTMNRLAARRGQEPIVGSTMFEYGLVPSYFSNAKTVRELGATFRPIDDTLRDAIDDFRHRGLLG